MSACQAMDPDAQALLERAAQAGYPPFESLSPIQARKAYAASWHVTQSDAGEVASVRDTHFTGPDGQLPVRIYRGLGLAPETHVPCMLFLHGGGWMLGNLNSHDRLCRNLANLAGICVVALDYRLAPEHPYPAALNDAAGALRALVEQAHALRIDPQRLSVAGDSAGGNLAAALALMACQGEVPPIQYQVLLYPALDLTALDSPDREAFHGMPLSATTMRHFINHYVGQHQDRLDWRASPGLAPDLSGVAPTLLLTVAHDPLCDEGMAYAQRLSAAGVRVTCLHLNDQMHGLLSQGRLIPAADAITDAIGCILGFELHRHPAPFSPHTANLADTTKETS